MNMSGGQNRLDVPANLAPRSPRFCPRCQPPDRVGKIAGDAARFQLLRHGDLAHPTISRLPQLKQQQVGFGAAAAISL
jgi:hypothetical protein